MDKDQWGKFLDDIAVIRRLTEDNHKAIFGDGKPGLIERVTTLESQAVHDLPQRVTKLESHVEAATWGIRAFFAVVGFVASKVIDIIVNWR